MVPLIIKNIKNHCVYSQAWHKSIITITIFNFAKNKKWCSNKYSKLFLGFCTEKEQ